MSETLSDDQLGRQAAENWSAATKLAQGLRKREGWPWRLVDAHADNFRRQIARATTWSEKAAAAREARRFFEALADTSTPEHRQLMKTGNEQAVFAPPGQVAASNTVGQASGFRVGALLGNLAGRGCSVSVAPDGAIRVTGAALLDETARRQLREHRGLIIEILNHVETF